MGPPLPRRHEVVPTSLVLSHVTTPRTREPSPGPLGSLDPQDPLTFSAQKLGAVVTTGLKGGGGDTESSRPPPAGRGAAVSVCRDALCLRMHLCSCIGLGCVLMCMLVSSPLAP